MHVIVLGAGVIGTTTAYYLARRGVDVTVVERQPGPAMETSHANAGELSYGYSTPWGAPGIPIKALKWLFQTHAPLAMQWDGSLFQLRWMMAMLRNCGAERYAINKERMLRLANHSRACLAQLREKVAIDYEGRSRGTLQLFRTEHQMEGAHKDMRALQECGIPYRLFEGMDVRQVEPALEHARVAIAGGLHLPDDETGDCFLFTQALAQHAQTLGVVFRYGSEVAQLVRDTRSTAPRIGGVQLVDGSLLKADAYVLAMGCYSRTMGQSLGIDLPVYPVKGYSLTLPVHHEARAPISTVLDETYKIAMTRFEQRIRVGGMAELSGFDMTLKPQRRATLNMVLDDLFPGGGDATNATFWTGLRPMTPDSTPILGPCAIPNLFLNTGHGTLGWTMACGSGHVVADCVMGTSTAIALDGLGVERYTNGSAPR